MATGIPVNLPHRGQVVIDYIDLWDEGLCGAGKLAYRGSYESMADLKAAIEETLQSSPIENPESATSVLSFGRFDSPDRHGFRKERFHDLYPYKSRWIVHFLLRFRFLSDFCYIDLGVNWAPYINPNDGKLYDKYPLGKYNFGDIIPLSDLSVLRVYNCTAEDAFELLKEFSLSDPEGDDLADLDLGISDDQLDELGDKVILSDEGNILVDDDSLLEDE